MARGMATILLAAGLLLSVASTNAQYTPYNGTMPSSGLVGQACVNYPAGNLLQTTTAQGGWPTCKEFCNSVENCFYYSLSSSSLLCQTFRACDYIHATPDTVSYEPYPWQLPPADAVGWVGTNLNMSNHRCIDSPPRGNFIKGTYIATGSTGCIDWCKSTKSCKYASFYRNTGWCSLYRDCQLIRPSTADSPITFKCFTDEPAIPAPTGIKATYPIEGSACEANNPVGNDLGGTYFPPRSTADMCAARCANTTGCGAFTFDTITLYCKSLKTCVAVANNTQVVSYVMPTSVALLTVPEMTCEATGQIGTPSVALNQHMCATRCALSSGCVMLVFDDTTKMCAIFSACGNASKSTTGNIFTLKPV